MRDLFLGCAKEQIQYRSVEGENDVLTSFHTFSNSEITLPRLREAPHTGIFSRWQAVGDSIPGVLTGFAVKVA